MLILGVAAEDPVEAWSTFGSTTDNQVLNLCLKSSQFCLSSCQELGEELVELNLSWFSGFLLLRFNNS